MKYFFSYSRHDGDFVKQLAQDLKDRSMNVWLDQLDIAPGVKWDTCIEQALNESAGIILVLSTSSVQSDNVMDEVNYAITKGKHVIPLLLDDCDVPFRLARIQQIDFKSDHQKGIATIIATINAQNAGAQNTVDAPVVNASIPPPPKPVSNYTSTPPPMAPPAQATGNKKTRNAVLIAAGIVVLLLAGLLISSKHSDTPAVSATVSATTDKTTTPQQMTGTLVSNEYDSVAYQVMGDKIRFYIKSKNDPNIYADVNQNKAVDSKTDRTYGLDESNELCTSLITHEEKCDYPTHANLSINAGIFVFTIPIDELSDNKDSVLVNFTFINDKTRDNSAYYPKREADYDLSASYCIHVK